MTDWTACVRHYLRRKPGERPTAPPPPPRRRWNPLAALWLDLGYAARTLRKSPTYAAAALTVLALGIGSATAVFSVVDAVVLRGLPFDEHDRLVAVVERGRGGDLFGGTTTPQSYLDWRAGQQVFEGLTAVSSTSFGLRDDDGHPQTVRATRATAEFFSVLRVPPMLGRPFTAAEESYGRHRVAVLSYGFWQLRLAGDRAAIGRTIALDDETWEIVGVMPRGFSYPVASALPVDLYVPPAFRDRDRVRRDSRNYGHLAIGRLKRGVSIAQASDQMNRLAAALDEQYPEWAKGMRVRVVAGDGASCPSPTSASVVPCSP